MKYINYLGNDAPTNIATDAWLLAQLHADEPVVALWQNERAVIVGQNQNAWAEVNKSYTDEHDIQVVRRVTGGGAVYHDLGNLNFSLIVPVASAGDVNFSTFVEPVVRALHNMGIPVEVTGRNDLVIDGKKVSGNAQRYQGGYLMHHGTLLFDTDVDTMVHALNVADEKFMSKAAKSVRARVGAIGDYVPEGMTMADFRSALLYELTNQGTDGEYVLSDEQWTEIKTLAQDKFSNWEWNWAKSPDFNFKNHTKFTGGALDVFAEVQEGKITDIAFGGDFLGVRDWREIKDAFIGLNFDAAEIMKVLDEHDEAQYFGTITNSEVASMFTEIGDHDGK
ncbi:lipoate--protein ligase [Weissella tructae]|jgi:lipoate-protein ligase A|uniref:lipoate--protein ligase n=2 Tax=Weissella TaxID=46255 RepID=A0A075U067_9LACO|nr:MULTISPECIES: lipoate--protein ligase [Weissella]AIG65598.1 Lipoate--protein ligase [Weissella tructae]AIM62913.1 Lipoate--protein ligase [Weissella ceti]AIM64311.1 Lipoate--protein ligase [Weissella ceti]ELA06945.1 lipoate-protein ligase [Weissella ceti NC36]QVV90726.1 lipoate--protein ligase [Weissella tructae]